MTIRFALHSHPWINLHHFLYQWSRADQGLGRGRRHVPVPEREDLRQLSPSDRRSWLSALQFYRDSIAEKNHFDDSMLALKRELFEIDADQNAALPDTIPGVATALATAAPIYWQHWWPRHDATNRRWIANVAPALREHEESFVELTQRVYGSTWPDEPWRIDVSAYANPSAGYTAAGHVVVYSMDPGVQGYYAAENIFHEIQHTGAIGRAARLRLTAAFAKADTPLPRNLWHGMIFGTAGEFTRGFVTATGEDYTPYWIREEFPKLRSWSLTVRLVNAHWLPAVRGDATPAEATAAMIRAARGQ